MAGGLAQATRGFLDSGGGGSALPAPAVSSTANVINVVFTVPVTITGTGAITANWVINGPYYTTVLTVTQINSTTIRLQTTNQNTGGNYTLHIPAGAVTVVSNGAGSPIFNVAFVGNGQNPSLVSALPLSLNQIRVTFSEPVSSISASTPGNYSLTAAGGEVVGVASATLTTPTTCLLVTTDMRPNTLYTLQSLNILDEVGNVIA